MSSASIYGVLQEVGTVYNTIARQQFQLSYQISPIIFTGGIAQNVQGGMLPVLSLIQAVTGLTTPVATLDVLDQYFAHFAPVSGGALNDYQIGEYPFANNSVAANAIIAMPLNFSMRMQTLVNFPAGFGTKTAVIGALKSSIDQHAILGGLYNVATPAFLYTNCILKQLRDVSDSASKIPQSVFQWDFTAPLVTLAQAAAAQSSLMTQITNATPINGQPSTSGPAASVGQPPSAPGTGVGAQSSSGTNVGGVAPGSNPAP